MASSYLRDDSAQINTSSPPAVFQFEDTDVRVLDLDGEPWFVGTDIASVLGYERPGNAVRAHCKGSTEMVLPSPGGPQLTKIIPERDVYRLIMRSKLPAAERFEEWVVGEVLPQIRKTGSYAPPAALESPAPMTEIVERLLSITEKLVDIMPKRIAAAEAAATAVVPAAPAKPTSSKAKSEEHLRVKDLVRTTTGGRKLRHADLVSIGRSMGKFCEDKGYETLMFQNRRIYPKSAVDAWLKDGGRAQIKACVEEGGHA